MTATATVSLVAFLSRRLDEDEADADNVVLEVANGVAEPLRDRVLAEVAAKRAVLEVHSSDHVWYADRFYEACVNCRGSMTGYALAPCPTLRALTSVYADHPDYDPAWA